MPSPPWERLQRIAELAKFLFNLETLLRHRENIEQKERDELLRLSYRHQVEFRNCNSLLAKCLETMKELAKRQLENASDQELTWFHLYIDRLGYEIAECKKRLARLEAEVQKQKEIVIEVSKKRKVLALLKSKKQSEYVHEMEKQEQKEIDEWVVARFAAAEMQTIGHSNNNNTKITE